MTNNLHQKKLNEPASDMQSNCCTSRLTCPLSPWVSKLIFFLGSGLVASFPCANNFEYWGKGPCYKLLKFFSMWVGRHDGCCSRRVHTFADIWAGTMQTERVTVSSSCSSTHGYNAHSKGAMPFGFCALRVGSSLIIGVLGQTHTYLLEKNVKLIQLHEAHPKTCTLFAKNL